MSDAITPAAPAATAVKKSYIAQFIDDAKGQIQAAKPATVASYARETGSVFADMLGSGAVGGGLGVVHGKWGLDSKIGPLDAWLAGLGAVVGVGLSGHLPEVASYARKMGEKAFTVFSFRRGYEAVKHEALPGGTAPGVQHIAAPKTGSSTVAGEEDPIERAARKLG